MWAGQWMRGFWSPILQEINPALVISLVRERVKGDRHAVASGKAILILPSSASGDPPVCADGIDSPTLVLHPES